jgi:hypothetical protein
MQQASLWDDSLTCPFLFKLLLIRSYAYYQADRNTANPVTIPADNKYINLFNI